MIARRLLVALTLVVAAIGLLPVAADAQYFGRNKVTYDDFEFRVLRTDHFDIHYYDADAEEAVRDFGLMAVAWTSEEPAEIAPGPGASHPGPHRALTTRW
jgi:hypothetical protein